MVSASRILNAANGTTCLMSTRHFLLLVFLAAIQVGKKKKHGVERVKEKETDRRKKPKRIKTRKVTL